MYKMSTTNRRNIYVPLDTLYSSRGRTSVSSAIERRGACPAPWLEPSQWSRSLTKTGPEAEAGGSADPLVKQVDGGRGIDVGRVYS